MCVVFKMIFFLSILLIKSAFSANILIVSHIASPSHSLWNRALASGLIEKGHNITMVSHEKGKVQSPNFTLIFLEGYHEKSYENFILDDLAEQNAISSMKEIYDWSVFWCEHDFTTKGLRTLLDYPKDYKFDLIIFDVTLGQCLYPLIERFNNPPVIGVTPFSLPPVLSHVFGNPLQTAYFPYYSTTYGDKMTFLERFLNFVYIYVEVLYRQYIALPAEMKLAQKYFSENIRPFEEVERNISLLLSNYDPILMSPLDVPPNIILVGGLQIKPPKALPKDLQRIMDEAKDGVIFFSLGTNLRSDQIGKEKRKIILDTLAKLPQTVLWKFEADNLDNLPKNVIIRKWFPQNDILGHPNTKLFISHGGGLGTAEAVYHGVPVVAIPFFIDHRANAGRLARRNLAKIVVYKKLTAESFYETITGVLNNPIYMENMKALSKKYRDQPETPLERAVFWVEYVLRHGSVEHLVLAARDMPFYQTFCLDILAVFALGVVLLYSVLVLLYTVLKFLFLGKFLNKS